MIDTLLRLLPKALQKWPVIQGRYQVDRYLLVSLHHPSNVDDQVNLHEILAALTEISWQIPVVFPVYHRTRQRMTGFGFLDVLDNKNIILLEPIGYMDFLALQAHAFLVLTGSGGIQEETTFLKIPCMTVRPNTEWPITITNGTNKLVTNKSADLITAIRSMLTATATTGTLLPALWDGHAAARNIAGLQEASL